MRTENIKYKDSGIPWIGMIPEDWEVNKAKIYFHQRNSKGNANAVLLAATQKFGMIPQTMVEGVVQVKVDTDLQFFKTIHKGDFVISLRSFQGGFELSEYEGVCSPAYQVFYNLKKIAHKYYKYLFKSYGFISKMNSLVVGIREGKNIQYKDFAESIIPIPPLPTQQRIADFLDRKCAEIDELAALQETMIAELKRYKQSVITEAVTGKVRVESGKVKVESGELKDESGKLKDESGKLKDESGKLKDESGKLKDSGVEWIGEVPEDWDSIRLKFLCTIQTGNQDTQDAVADGVYPFYVRSPLVEHSNKCSFEGEGILMAGDGAGAGRVFHHVYGKYAVHQRVYRLANFIKINSDYLFYFLSSLFCKEMDRGSAQSTVPSVRLPMLQNFCICLPPLSTQQAIADYLDKKCAEIDELIAIKQQKIEALKEYKKSVIFEYVTGKKEVKE